MGILLIPPIWGSMLEVAYSRKPPYGTVGRLTHRTGFGLQVGEFIVYLAALQRQSREGPISLILMSTPLN